MVVLFGDLFVVLFGDLFVVLFGNLFVVLYTIYNDVWRHLSASLLTTFICATYRRLF
jgi:hypothetical protein